MSFYAYAKKILGEEKWKELLAVARYSYGHNLYIKKWSYISNIMILFIKISLRGASFCAVFYCKICKYNV